MAGDEKFGYSVRGQKEKRGVLSAEERVECFEEIACIRCQIKSNHFYCHITTARVPW